MHLSVLGRTVGIALLGPLGLAVACAPTPQSPADPGGVAPAEKQSGGVFQYASQRPPDGLYWYDLGTIGGRGRPVSASQIWNGLINFGLTDNPQDPYEGSGEYSADLAEGWSQPDPRTFVFKLRQGVKWHDGKEFTSKDVVWSLQRWGDVTSVRRNRTMAGKLERVEAPGPHEVRFVFKEPDPDILIDLARSDYKILPAHIAEAAGNPTGDDLRALYEKNVVGTGPFKLKTFDRQRHLELERFEEYWGGRPHLDGTRAVFGIERSAMQAAFIARQLDYVSMDDRVQFDTVKATVPEAWKLSYTTGHNWGLQFNVTRPPFNDVRVRKAIHLGIDRQKLLDAVTFGEGSIAGPPPVLPTLTDKGWGIPRDEFMKLPGWRTPKDQDIAEAKRLLAEAGYPNGLKVTLVFRSGISHPTTQSEPVASQMKSIGVDMEVRPTEPGVYASQVYRDKDFEVANDGMTSGYAMGSFAYSKWHSKGPNNIMQLNDPELDRLIEAAMGEFDREKRNRLFTQMQRIIVDKAYMAPIVTLTQHLAVQPWVHDFYPSFSVQPDLLDAARIWMDVKNMPEPRRTF